MGGSEVAWPCIVVHAMMMISLMLNTQQIHGALPANTQKLIDEANEGGPYLGLVIPNSFEMKPLLQSPNFTSTDLIINFSGRRFRFGTIANKKVILVMTGLSLINAGITTQLLLTLFNIEGVVHYGIAGTANPSLNIGDVAIPHYWAHTALWNWQRYGKGPEDELPLEANGDYTREFGYLNVANYTVNVTDGSSYDNLLNNIWFQPEEVFPIDGTPEERQHAFWVAVDPHYYEISQKVEDVKLEGCLNSTTCLSNIPKVARVQRGASASIYLDNAAYRGFLYNKFNISPMDMETASVALICLQQRVPFIAIRALSDLAGGGSAKSNEADTFSPLAAKNSVTVVVEFIKQLSAAATISV
ncbi:PREDICTED: bark storage protein A-like [Prunus mume]|uniref:Bark storage protein A-like n=1 Tax=Prunus mume TaxID=102107 RepID=A0ABM0N620_PRUMU|nr:PREDICTED: bark storage protein A-like [Prunus mume]